MKRHHPLSIVNQNLAVRYAEVLGMYVGTYVPKAFRFEIASALERLRYEANANEHSYLESI